MNNPLTDLISGLGTNIGGVLNGTNPANAPQLTSLFGYTVPGIPLISSRDYFLTQMESWITSIPLKTQWVVLIQGYPKALTTQVIQQLERTEGNSHNFDITSAVNKLKSYPLNNVVGCLLAQGVGIPENENNNVNYTENGLGRGFINGIVSSGGRPFDGGLSINFLETNTSFVDFVVRPWVILTSHYGYVARPPQEADKDMSTTITILQYTRSFQKLSMIPRKVWMFYNCYPVNVSAREFTYDNEGMDSFQVRWVYSNYAVQNTLYLPLPDIISKIAGAFKNPSSLIPQISPLQSGSVLPRIPGL